jgi:hypothetical protein
MGRGVVEASGLGKEDMSMATHTKSKGQVVDSAKLLIAGTSKRLANATQVEFMGSSFTPAQITSTLQQLVDLRSDVDAAKATVKAKVAAEEAAMPSLHAFTSAFVAYIKVAFGASPEALADFGITPKVRTPLTTDAIAAANAKRSSTRKARHTMGTNQKKAIKGTVTGVVVTPIEATPVAAPSSPAAPATSGSSPATAAVTPTRTA